MNEERKFYVYAYLRARDSKNGKAGTPYYIGKGTLDRAFSKLHTAKPPKDRSLVVFLGWHMNEADAFQAEMLMIHLHGRIDLGTGCLRNMTDGGEGNSGRRFSDEHRRRLGAAQRGKTRGPLSEEHRRKIGAANHGHKQAAEVVAKRVESFKSKHHTSPWKGKKRGEETGKRISASKKGKSNGREGHVTPIGVRQKIAESNRRSKPTTSATGYRGVYMVPRAQRPYRAQIVVGKERKHIGYFASAEEASAAYEKRHTELYGERSAA